MSIGAHTQEEPKITIELTPEQRAAFERGFKIGIYKELHHKGFLSDGQLHQLVLLQNDK